MTFTEQPLRDDVVDEGARRNTTLLGCLANDTGHDSVKGGAQRDTSSVSFDSKYVPTVDATSLLCCVALCYEITLGRGVVLIFHVTCPCTLHAIFVRCERAATHMHRNKAYGTSYAYIYQ